MTKTTLRLDIYEQVTKDLGFSLESIRQNSVIARMTPPESIPSRQRTKRERHKLNRAQNRILKGVES